MSQEMIELMDEFKQAFDTDDESLVKRGIRLVSNYKKATEQQKELIDDTFITLCGYSFSTLMGDYDEKTR